MPLTAPKGPTLSVVSNPKTHSSLSGPQVLQPSGWPMPKGYANGMAADGRLVVTGGVIGWDTQGHLAPDFVAQLPRTETGKLKRTTLRQIAQGGHASAGVAAE